MKKITFVLALLFCSVFCFAQRNLSVHVTDEIYGVLDYYQNKGLLKPLSGVKPYTQGKIVACIDEILENQEKLSETEIAYLEGFKKSLEPETDKKNSTSHLAFINDSDKFHVSFLYDFCLDSRISGGFYNDSSMNSAGFDIMPVFNFRGDITKYLSYNMYAYFDASYMPIQEVTEDYEPYFIGYYWYDKDTGIDQFLDGKYKDEAKTEKYDEPHRRTVKKFKNNSYLPYAYHKPWSGQIYLVSNLSASGLEGWATEPGISGGVCAEVRSSLFNDRVSVGAGRNNKEWAGMENGSSLVLNANAQPFFEFDCSVKLFDWLSFSSLVGILEYPNQDFINNDAYDQIFKNKDEATVFQNAFSINMIDLDWKYFHFDFGSNAIWPKRFEIGYMFPLLFYVEYQNHIGDYDNMALFSDIKVRYPGLGSIWASIYLDEINGLNNDPIKSSRAMFAGQLGTKVVLPFLNCSSLSMRYTKVEPYCYTHNSINYSPWYSHYINESYVTGGESLGYYLDPNSDEFFLRFDTKPTSNTSCHLQYQFIRHGADYGSQQVPGSSLYSELSPSNRDELEKYFLHDGAYNWMHIVSLGGSVKTKSKKNNTIEAGVNLGFLYSYYTMIDSESYDRSVYGNNGNCKDVDESTKYFIVDTDEYPIQWGFVLGGTLKVTF